jgi:hypothetical protein
MKRKLLTETLVCPRECLVIISYTSGLSFALERIGPLAAIVITIFYLLVLYLLALPNTPENPFASIYSESLIKTTCQHLLLLVGFDTLIYQKYYDTPPILVGHHHSKECKNPSQGNACTKIYWTIYSTFPPRRSVLSTRIAPRIVRSAQCHSSVPTSEVSRSS